MVHPSSRRRARRNRPWRCWATAAGQVSRPGLRARTRPSTCANGRRSRSTIGEASAISSKRANACSTGIRLPVLPGLPTGFTRLLPVSDEVRSCTGDAANPVARRGCRPNRCARHWSNPAGSKPACRWPDRPVPGTARSKCRYRPPRSAGTVHRIRQPACPAGKLTASGVLSRPVKPVPPVINTTCTTSSAIQVATCARIL